MAPLQPTRRPVVPHGLWPAHSPLTPWAVQIARLWGPVFPTMRVPPDGLQMFARRVQCSSGRGSQPGLMALRELLVPDSAVDFPGFQIPDAQPCKILLIALIDLLQRKIRLLHLILP